MGMESGMMRIRSTLILLTAALFVTLLLISCRQGRTDNPIAGWVPGGTQPPLLDETAAVTLAELMQNPAAYVGQRVQLTGQFYRSAPLACSTVTRRSPAPGVLTDGEAAVAIGGSYEQLERIVPNGLTLTVAGRWWVWRGPVGCGKNLPLTEVWYLDIAEIIAPNPITFATLTPLGQAVAELSATPLPPSTEEQPTLPPEPGGFPTFPADLGDLPTLPSDLGELPITFEVPPELLTAVFSGTQTSPLTLTPPGAVTFTPTLTRAPGQPAETPTFTITPNETSTPTLTPAAPPTPDPKATQTPTATTGPSATPTATATAGPSPTPTATVAGGVVNKGELEAENLAVEIIAAGETHQWQFVVDSSDVLTVNVASPVTMDMVVTVLDGSNNVLQTQNNANNGAPEIVVTNLPGAGTYLIRLNEAAGLEGSYSMILQDSASYAFVFKGTLEYGDAESVLMAPQSDHFWHFLGNEGDSIAVLVAPNDNVADVFFELYGPDATQLLDEPVDDGDAGFPEFLIGYVLPETGFYAIRVGEFTFGSADYAISLDSFDFP
ncbi:MAG: hypothetical protein Fur0021_34470 [Candidatus Promineifilaceae bacterium]